MRRRRPRRTSWASRGGRRVPPTCRSSIWPARRGRRRRPCLRADGRHRLRRRRSLESSRCCLLYLGRRRRHRLPGVRRLRRRRRPVLVLRRRLRLSSWRRLRRKVWCNMCSSDIRSCALAWPRPIWVAYGLGDGFGSRAAFSACGCFGSIYGVSVRECSYVSFWSLFLARFARTCSPDQY